MDPSESRPSPRRELQGPRPAPLRVSKDSYKIKKPPVAPSHHSQPPADLPPRPPPQQHRDPVIIYAVSPKIIHTDPSEFMTLVQRLTGSNSGSQFPPPPSPPGGALSPAARIASFEKATSSPRAASVDQWEIDRPASFPGILSPVPASLPPISPNLFSPSFDPSVLSFLHDLSPAFATTINSGNRSFFDGGSNYSSSPATNLLSTPTLPSPGAFWDLMSQFPDM
ncbi:protein MKS1-like [Musa acuminata AAA Group]|uniref:(wild Malaysian banana) hypothetical protein n=1 Tax=Musa acuminata subsp. malaccensis TaxID=214687 RepID=A0A804I5M9_MUSAM|nr:PREDICTED: protein MKS1-like [Musa acuminata subsp. malaccensis]CAG1862816.1 unnamed protein product [Musa acuminata subsp. malaccensis]